MDVPPVNLRGRANFVPHLHVPIENVGADSDVQNIIFRARNAEEMWIEECTAKIGGFRSLVRSVYLRWAILINASELAESRYRGMSQDQALQTLTIRVVDGDLRNVPLAVWPAPEAADNYARTTPLIAANGLADLYGALEDIVFELYEVFLSHNPQSLMKGDEFRALRRLWGERGVNAAAGAAWKTAWKERFDNWRRKRAYDGLDTVFAAFYQHARLRRPRSYRLTDVEDWARTIKMIGELRHLVVHGAAVASDALANLSGTPTSMTFDFVAGEQLEVHLHHLQSVECFCDQLLTAINLSLVERAVTVVALPSAASVE